jgi:hypothetical protein
MAARRFGRPRWSGPAAADLTMINGGGRGASPRRTTRPRAVVALTSRRRMGRIPGLVKVGDRYHPPRPSMVFYEKTGL